MALEMKETSRWWYARFLINGKLRRFPVMETRGGKPQRIEVRGRRPASLKHPEQGDAVFLESYHRARAAHDRLLEEELSKKSVEDLAQRIIEAKTGARLDFVKIEAVPDAWAAIPRKRPPSRQYVETAKGKLRSFADFIRQNYPKVDDLAAVRADHVRAFLEREAARGISPRTWNIALKLLKTVFVKLEPNADAYRAFLKNAAFRDEDTIHREPFQEKELASILEASRSDEVLRGPIVTALCTAMRRGDCALLKWSSVDLAAGFVEVRTSKTGETAEIPILPMLREELGCQTRGQSEYVFPQAAALYQRDPSALDRRLKGVLARAEILRGCSGAEGHQAEDATGSTTPPTPSGLAVDELRRKGREAIDAGKMIQAKRERMRAVFAAYMDGQPLPRIARDLGVSKGMASQHLSEIERMIGAAVVRRRPPSPVHRETRDTHSGGQRLKRASVRGWHSFRVAFVTRALAAGMPEELVRKVTGHTAVDVVRRHYFKPGREEFRREFEKAAPRLLMNGAKSRDEQLREIIERVTPKTWKKDKVRLLEILDGN